jgi:hypothetical protein
MKQAVSQETNRANLRYTANLLNSAGIEWFIFFGTLLGLTRDNDVIKGDDDIDIYVDSRSRTRLIELLNQQGLAPNLACKPNHTQHFLQIARIVDGEAGLIDFYFFDRQSKPGVLIDRWNFLQKYDQLHKALHVPSDMVFPLSEAPFLGVTLKTPRRPRDIVQWLYGKEWETPLDKSFGYEISVSNYRPLLKKRMPRHIERWIPRPFRPIARRIYFGKGSSKAR